MVREAITIFGGSGFVGRYVVSRLAARGCEIRVVTRRPDRASFLKVYGDVGQIVPLASDLRDEKALLSTMEGSTAVINLIGIIAQSKRESFESVHVEVPRRIGLACNQLGIKNVVHLSAIGASVGAEAEYSRSKGYGERVLMETLPEVKIVRPSLIFGPEDKFFNLFAQVMTLSPLIPLMGGGKTRFQPVYVGDCAQAVINALEVSEQKTYEAGGPHIYTFRELMELISKTIRRKRWFYSVPWSVAFLKARVLEVLPSPLLTRDQVRLLMKDSVVSSGALTLEDLGITPTAVEAIIPSYLERFRPGGRFSRHYQ